MTRATFRVSEIGHPAALRNEPQATAAVALAQQDGGAVLGNAAAGGNAADDAAAVPIAAVGQHPALPNTPLAPAPAVLGNADAEMTALKDELTGAYRLGLLNHGKRWTADDLRRLRHALSRLPDPDKALLTGVWFIREGHGPPQGGGRTTQAATHVVGTGTRDPMDAALAQEGTRPGQVHVHSYQEAFQAHPQMIDEDHAIVHEIGHVRLARQSTAALDDAVGQAKNRADQRANDLLQALSKVPAPPQPHADAFRRAVQAWQTDFEVAQIRQNMFHIQVGAVEQSIEELERGLRGLGPAAAQNDVMHRMIDWGMPAWGLVPPISEALVDLSKAVQQRDTAHTTLRQDALTLAEAVPTLRPKVELLLAAVSAAHAAMVTVQRAYKLDCLLILQIPDFVGTAARKNFDWFTDYAKGSPHEWYAESYALYVLDQPRMEANSRAMRAWFGEREDLQRFLDPLLTDPFSPDLGSLPGLQP